MGDSFASVKAEQTRDKINSGQAEITQSGNLLDYTRSTGLPDYDGDWLGWLRRRAEAGDEAALDKLFSYYMSESSAETARNWSASREDTAYQRLVADMKAAGFNPYALLAQQGSPISSSSDGRSYSGTQWTTARHNDETEKINWSKTILSTLATVASIAVFALLA